MCPDLGKHSVRDPRTIRAMHAFSSLGRNLFFVKVQILSYTCRTTLPLTIAVVYGG